MTVLINFLLVAVGFVFLIKGADLLVDSASSIAKKFNISELVIGLTVVALGTSAPEMVVNSISALKNHDDVVFGNVIGSNIFNLFLILGVSGLIFPMSVRKNTVWKEIPFSLVISMVLFVLVNDRMLFGNAENSLSKIDGAILLALFVGFVAYILYSLKKENDDSDFDTSDIHVFNYLKSTLLLIVGIVGLAVGGNLVVNSAVEIAKQLQVSEKLIGLTIISAGTSLPELATSVVAAVKKKSDIAVGNVLGSNILNITLILGLSSFLAPLNYNTQLNVDFYVLFGGTTLLFLFMFTLHIKKLDRWEAAVYVVGFVAYLAFLFIRK